MENTGHSHDQNQKKQDLIKLSTLSIIILIILSLLYSGCCYRCDKSSYMTYEAVYMDMVLREAVSFTGAESIQGPSGLYFRDGYVFINEKGRGIHIIDDTNPNTPVPAGFISIPGNFSLAAKSNYLYADNYTDLLVFDIMDPDSPGLIRREENVFTDFSAVNTYFDQANNSIITYIEAGHEDTECSDDGHGSSFRRNYEDTGILIIADGVSGPENSTGEAGSMARFAVDGEIMCAVDRSEGI